MNELPAYLRKALNNPAKEAQLVAEAAFRGIDIRVLLGAHWGLFSEREAGRFSAEKLATWIVRAAYELHHGKKIDEIRRTLLGAQSVRQRPKVRMQRRSGPHVQVNPERAAAYRYMRAQLDSMSD